jgi:hypothetical protein
MAGEADSDECNYEQGRRSALKSVLVTCVSELGYSTADSRCAAWIVERESAIAALRDVCADHGDNDWDNKLHLADIIEKHLHRNLG